MGGVHCCFDAVVIEQETFAHKRGVRPSFAPVTRASYLAAETENPISQEHVTCSLPLRFDLYGPGGLVLLERGVATVVD